MRYAVIRDGLVENVIAWDGKTEWTPDPDVSVIDCPDHVGPGWFHNESGWIAPPPPPKVIVEDPA